MSAMKDWVIFWGIYMFCLLLGIGKVDGIGEREYSLL
jgi:hypothetical protein